MWSMPVVLTEWENENDSQNQCESMQHYVIFAKWRHRHDTSYYNSEMGGGITRG